MQRVGLFAGIARIFAGREHFLIKGSIAVSRSDQNRRVGKSRIERLVLRVAQRVSSIGQLPRLGQHSRIFRLAKHLEHYPAQLLAIEGFVLFGRTKRRVNRPKLAAEYGVQLGSAFIVRNARGDLLQWSLCSVEDVRSWVFSERKDEVQLVADRALAGANQCEAVAEQANAFRRR